MPPLERPKQAVAVILPERSAVVAAETDVLVVGGGPAGIGAALGAAQAGARVILAERYGFLGGNATAALVTMFTTYYTRSRRRPRIDKFAMFPTDHGPGKPVIDGVLSTLVERLVQAGGALPPQLVTGHTVPFDPEVFKLVSQDLLDATGVRVLFHAFASGVTGKEKIDGVVFETKSGPVLIKARTIVDCTGDGDVAAAAGAPYRIGRDEDGLTQPMTLYFRVARFARQSFEQYVLAHPGQWNGVFGLWELIKQAAQNGDLHLPREDILMFATPDEQEVSVNSTRVVKVLGTDVWDLTYAEWKSRQQMRMIHAFFKKYVPGFERSYIVQSGVSIGVRETRRIQGDYVLTGPDILSARKFEDVIAQGTYPLDIHNPKGKGTILKRLPPNKSYDIPLRCLLPQNTANLLVAGRCISGNHGALASYRVMPICIATGQAAGVCAALAAKHKKSPRQIPIGDVQTELIKQKVDIHEAVTA
jgi:ribulose 1,5-bisphosphate synthetase/thiazole synthase